jgi:hypothetical protein
MTENAEGPGRKRRNREWIQRLVVAFERVDCDKMSFGEFAAWHPELFVERDNSLPGAVFAGFRTIRRGAVMLLAHIATRAS